MRDRRIQHVHRIGIVALLLAGVLLVSAAIAVASTAAQSVPPLDPLSQILIQQNNILNAISGVAQNWDKNLPAAQRFVILAAFGGAAVLDRNTGLVWERSPSTAVGNWLSARNTCLNMNVGGTRGWRLPAIPELASLIDPSVGRPGPYLPPGHPFVNVQPADYWSASTVADTPSLAWLVEFNTSRATNFQGNKSQSHYAWCARGGMHADVY